MIRRPPRSTQSRSSAASDVYKRQNFTNNYISFVIGHPYLPNFIIQELNKNPDFIEKLRVEKDFPRIEKFKVQVEDAIARGIIKPIRAEQLFINLSLIHI